MIVTLKYSPGDTVIIKDAEFEAHVNRILIERGAVLYECEWWDNKSQFVKAFYDSELTPKEQATELLIVKEA